MANTAPFAGDLHIGQYSGTLGPDFQLTGRITGVKIYHRPLDPAEVAKAAEARPE